MPVHPFKERKNLLYQRQQYAVGGVGRIYWDFRDRMIFEYIRVEDETLLDAGCGEGITLEKMLSLFPDRQITGIDLDDENIAICEKHNLPVVKADLNQIPWEDNYFDCITLIEVIEHLPQPENLFKEIARILKPGGRLIVLFPNDFAFKIARLLTFYWREAFADAGHQRQFHPKNIIKMAKANGLHRVAGKGLPLPIWPFALHYLLVLEKDERRS
jgi:ubiquinone/menaquinone biosynthesis C-methylase UbiE